MKNKRFSFLLLVCIPICLFAQRNPQPHFRNYSTEHGLSSPEVYVAFQDSKGYMWFGTDNGTSRFDGYHFKNYGAKEGLTSNVVFDIFEDEDENIWFGTMTGEAFILKGDTIEPYRFNHLVQRYSKDFRDASLVYLKENGTAYFELIDLGILTIDSTGKDSLISTEQPLSKLILEVDQLKEVLGTHIRRRHDERWISSINYLEKNQLFNVEIVSEKGRLQVNLPFIDLQNPTQFKAQKTTNGELLIFYYAHLYYLENEALVWIRPFDYTVNEIIKTEDQSIWICGTQGNGLRRYRDVKALKNGKYDLFLNDLSISDFYEDQNGGLWVTTQEKGIYYCANWEQLIYNTDFGFSVNSINSVTFKNEQEIYVGTQNKDIFQVDLKENRRAQL